MSVLTSSPRIGPLPAIFGLNIATYILCELAGKPISNPLPVKGRKKFNERLARDLQKREEKFLGRQLKYVPLLPSLSPPLPPATRARTLSDAELTTRPSYCILHSKLPLDDDDLGLLFDDIHRGRSVRPPFPVPERPALVRWDPEEPLLLTNCVSFEFADAERHLKEVLLEKRRPEDVWGTEVAEVVVRRREEARRVVEWVM